MKEEVLLIGAGPMAVEYAKVLLAMHITPLVIGRGEGSAVNFKNSLGLRVYTGGLESWLKLNSPMPPAAIVAVSESQLGKCTISLLQKKIKKILVEKPGAFNHSEIQYVAEEAASCTAKVLVAYNRRFYSSVKKLKEIIAEDGGVSSFTFDFTEWSHIVEKVKKDAGVKEQWFLHNSTHVIDLAFYLGGKPKEISSYSSGGLSWHPSASVFSGSGVTEGGCIFSYHANWEAPGRWGVEIFTKKRRIVLRPLEKLQVQEIGSTVINPLGIDDKLDTEFKPGVYRQVEAFLNNDYADFCDIKEQADNLKFYKKIGYY